MAIDGNIVKIIKCIFKYGYKKISEQLNIPLDKAVNETSAHFKDQLVIRTDKLREALESGFSEDDIERLNAGGQLLDEDSLTALLIEKADFVIDEGDNEANLAKAKDVMTYFKQKFEEILLKDETSAHRILYTYQLMESEKRKEEHEELKEEIKAEIRDAMRDFQKKLIPGPPAFETILDHWFDNEIDTMGYLDRRILDGHLDDEPFSHPLKKEWRSFLNATPWHENIRSSVRLILEKAKYLEKDWVPLKLVNTLEKVQWQASYDAILSNLQPLTSKKKLEAVLDYFDFQLQRIEKNAIEEEGIGEGNLEQKNKLLDLKNEIISLSEILKKSVFRLCFMVSGSHGSGKTHFIASLLANRDKRIVANNYILLLIQPREFAAESPLEDTLLECVNRVSGYFWKTWDEFSGFMETHAAGYGDCKFIIAFDGLDQWSRQIDDFYGILLEYVSKWSRYHFIRWVFTTDDINLGTGAYSKHFRRYSNVHSIENDWLVNRKKECNFMGWYMLDRLNADWETGTGILENYWESRGRIEFFKELENDREDRYETLNQLLNRPLIAWLLVEWAEDEPVELEAVVNLTYIGFMDHFFKRLQGKLAAVPGTKRYSGGKDIKVGHIITTIDCMSDFFVQSRDFFPLREDVRGNLIKFAGKKNSTVRRYVDSLLKILEDEHLIQDVWVEEPEYEQRLKLLYRFFWEWRLARRMNQTLLDVPDPETRVREALEQWFGDVTDEVGSGIWQFLLMEVDRKWPGKKRDLNKQVWQLGIQSDVFPRGAIWLAGPKAGKSTQDYLGQQAMALERLPTDGIHMYGLMYFVDWTTASITIAERLGILQPCFEALKQTDMTEYYLYIADRWLSETEYFEDIVDVMSKFHGCETLGLAEVLAYLSVDELFKYPEDIDDAFIHLYNYLRDYCPDARTYFHQTGGKKRWKRYYFREWVLYYFLRKLLQYYGKDDFQTSMELLEDHRWFQRRANGFNKTVGFDMQRECSIAFGYWFRETVNMPKAEPGDENEDAGMETVHPIDQYLSLLTELVESNNQYKRQLAFFMIYHTEITKNKKTVIMKKEFLPLLERLWQEPGLDWAKDRFSSFFHDNFRYYKITLPGES